jgi:putative membrane protein
MSEVVLAFIHLSAVLGWVVFASSQAALCRAEWMNAAVVRRLVRLDTILWVATAAVLLSGLARSAWGAKGAAWYWGNGLLHLKLTLFVVVAIILLGASRRYRRWRAVLDLDGSLPPTADVAAARKRVMVATHVVALLPLAGILMARGYGG